MDQVEVSRKFNTAFLPGLLTDLFFYAGLFCPSGGIIRKKDIFKFFQKKKKERKKRSVIHLYDVKQLFGMVCMAGPLPQNRVTISGPFDWDSPAMSVWHAGFIGSTFTFLGGTVFFITFLLFPGGSTFSVLQVI